MDLTCLAGSNDVRLEVEVAPAASMAVSGGKREGKTVAVAVVEGSSYWSIVDFDGPNAVSDCGGKVELATWTWYAAPVVLAGGAKAMAARTERSDLVVDLLA